MRKIPFSAKEVDVEFQIAPILHETPFKELSPERLINFRVSLFRDRRKQGRAHGGTGLLTVPTEGIGNLFLNIYSGASFPPRFLRINHQPIAISRSNKPLRQHIVDDIRVLPFVDPVGRKKREERLESLRGQVNISTVQFGYERRDGTFSVEWERDGDSYLEVDDQNRRMNITLPTDEVPKPRPPEPSFQIPGIVAELMRGLVLDVETSAPSPIIQFRYSQIKGIARDTDSEHPLVFISFEYPPTFGKARPMGLFDEDSPKKEQLSYFDEEHRRVAPFTSTSMCFRCSSKRDLRRLEGFLRIVQLGKWIGSDVPERNLGELFSEDRLAWLRSWLKRLPLEVASQVDSIHHARLADILELETIESSLDRLLRRMGPELGNVVKILKEFSVQLAAWEEEDQQDGGQTVLQIFDRAVGEFKVPVQNRTQQWAPGVFDCLHVRVTPTSVHIEGPFPERSNRVIRLYPGKESYFIRVAFTDERNLQYRFDRDIDGQAFVRERVGGILRSGLLIGGRQFRFLAYSMSALKEHSVWFMSPFRFNMEKVTPESIRSNLGTFDNVIRFPSLYGARMSQAFSATEPSVTVEADRVLVIPDVWRNESCFTDGVGTLSPELADDIRGTQRDRRFKRRQTRVPPSCFQIRFSGSKGMLSVDHRLKGRELRLRDSMVKFESPSNEVEIAKSFERPSPMTLNRPMIMLLEGLGVPSDVFLELQRMAVNETKAAAEDISSASRLLATYGLGTSFRVPSVWNSLHKMGLSIASAGLGEDLFTMRILDYSVNHVLRELKHHARIPVPGSWTLVGVADVHNVLKEGEIFACIRESKDEGSIYLEGPCWITRSPVIHPGDIQKVVAIGKPPPGSPYDIEPLTNSVVFSVKGTRSLPSCLGGGDLDGDMYNIIMDSNLFPEKAQQPARYDEVQRFELDHDSTIDDVINFVVEFINSDVLGLVATNWLIIADQSTQQDHGANKESVGIFDAACLKLAELHSAAVDYQKRGTPVPLVQIPRLKFPSKPDWNQPEIGSTEGDFYESQRAIGKLYRDINLSSDVDVKENAKEQKQQIRRIDVEETLSSLELGMGGLDDPISGHMRLRVEEFVDISEVDDEEYSNVLQIFETYRRDFQYICQTNTLSNRRDAMTTEEEVAVGTIVARCSQPRQRRDIMAKMRERTDELVISTKADISGGNDIGLGKWLQRAWIAWEISERSAKKEVFGARSFGIIALGSMFEALVEYENVQRRHH